MKMREVGENFVFLWLLFCLCCGQCSKRIRKSMLLSLNVNNFIS